MNPALDPFVSGAMAGLAVDVSLFPIDTIKTRMQAKGGIWQNGRFKGLYSGLSVAAVGSMPSAAIFFGVYDKGKIATSPYLSPVATQVAAASVAECAACVIRVPVDQMKQQMQQGQFRRMRRAWEAAASKGVAHMYRGYRITIAREIPFSAIQFPLYELLKRYFAGHPLLCGLAGMMAGGIAAAVTTPLDVAKTRIMLGQTETRSVPGAVLEVARAEGLTGMFRGVAPRTFWISLGGFFFFLTYEGSMSVLSNARKQLAKEEAEALAKAME